MKKIFENSWGELLADRDFFCTFVRFPNGKRLWISLIYFASQT